MTKNRHLAQSSNGRIPGLDPGDLGSNPSRAAYSLLVQEIEHLPAKEKVIGAIPIGAIEWKTCAAIFDNCRGTSGHF